MQWEFKLLFWPKFEKSRWSDHIGIKYSFCEHIIPLPIKRRFAVFMRRLVCAFLFIFDLRDFLEKHYRISHNSQLFHNAAKHSSAGH